jgi:hypothetical protein
MVIRSSKSQLRQHLLSEQTRCTWYIYRTQNAKTFSLLIVCKLPACKPPARSTKLKTVGEATAMYCLFARQSIRLVLALEQLDDAYMTVLSCHDLLQLCIRGSCLRDIIHIRNQTAAFLTCNRHLIKVAISKHEAILPVKAYLRS